MKYKTLSDGKTLPTENKFKYYYFVIFIKECSYIIVGNYFNFISIYSIIGNYILLKIRFLN